jgi:hypothetical protein
LKNKTVERSPSLNQGPVLGGAVGSEAAAGIARGVGG